MMTLQYLNWVNKGDEAEEELGDYLRSLYNGNIKTKVDDIKLNNIISFYMPDIKTIIQFVPDSNTDLRDYGKFHRQQLVKFCIKQNIRVIHIFEYEWRDEDKRNKLKNYLQTVMGNGTSVYARKTKIRKVDFSEIKEFEDTYHLQGNSLSAINYILTYNDEIVGTMTFGKPRFNNNYEYEMVRLCYRSDIRITGGSEKMFHQFLKDYDPKSIISYCDLSKFQGNTYYKLGFSKITQEITDPNYVWYNPETGEIMRRYQTQKKKLVKRGMGDDSQTEMQIMQENGFVQIHDCGNLKVDWIKSRDYAK